MKDKRDKLTNKILNSVDKNYSNTTTNNDTDTTASRKCGSNIIPLSSRRNSKDPSMTELDFSNIHPDRDSNSHTEDYKNLNQLNASSLKDHVNLIFDDDCKIYKSIKDDVRASRCKLQLQDFRQSKSLQFQTEL